MTTNSVICIDEVSPLFSLSLSLLYPSLFSAQHQTTSKYGLFIVVAMTDPSHCFMADEDIQTPSYQDIQLVVETQKPGK